MRPRSGGDRESGSTWVLLSIVAALLVVLAVVVEPMRVTSVSMSPTLSRGDHILIDKLTGLWRPPAVDDLVVFRDPEGGALAVKRVVALEGQVVALEDGVLHVDGVARDEPGIDASAVDSVYFGPVTVPPGTVFVLGDNRGDSVDSRTYGSVPLDDLVGRVALSL